MERNQRLYDSLSDSQKTLKHAIYALMERNGLEPQELQVFGPAVAISV